MTAPHLDSNPEVATETTPQPQAQSEAPISAPTPGAGGYVVPSAPVDNQPTAAERLSAWWNHSLPHGARTALTQFLMALVVVLLVLPLASAFGWFGLHNVTPAKTSGSTQTTIANSASPNAPAHQIYDAQLAPAPTGDTVNVHLTTQETLLSIAPGIAYKAWTFNGTVPGPVVHVRQGQTINFTLDNTKPATPDAALALDSSI